MKILLIVLCIINFTLSLIKVKDNSTNATVGNFFDADAKFGGDFVDGAIAYLFESQPILACNDTINPPLIYMPNESNIIFVSLIQRGICTFEHKVRAAQNSGYHGVIIYNNNSDDFFQMPKPDNSNDVFIPSRMVGRTSGYKLKQFTYTATRQQFLVIFYQDLDFNPQYYIIAFLGFVSLGFLLIGIGFAIKLCRDYVKRRANRLKKCHLNKIPIKKFIKGDDNFDTCAICLEDFVDGQKLRILPCNHGYHVKCIDPWLLKQKRNCPICKSRIRIPGREDESDDNSLTTPSETANVLVDEHTPLINPSDGVSAQSYFSYNEVDVNFAPEYIGIPAQICYENPCIDDCVDDKSENHSSDIVTNVMCINNDCENAQSEEDSKVIPSQSCHLEDLIKMV